jgi:hypothetical protein
VTQTLAATLAADTHWAAILGIVMNSVQVAVTAVLVRITVRQEHVFRVLPDDVRQLEAGHAFVIAGGRAARVRILRLELPEGLDAGAIPPPDPPALPSQTPGATPQVPGV